MPNGSTGACAIPAFSLALTLATPALAGTPFQWEVGGDYLARTLTVRTPLPGGIPGTPGQAVETDLDSDTFGATAQWFLAPVPTGEGPLEQAGFLARASSLTAAFARSDTDNFDNDTNTLSLGGLYQFDEDWFVTATLARSETGFPTGTSDATTVGVGVGRYVGPTTALRFSYSRSETDFSVAGIGANADFDSFAVSIEHVGKLGRDWQFAVDAALAVPDGDFDDTTFGGALTLYPTSNLGVGANLAAAIGDTGDNPQTFGLFGRWFINDAWSVSARYDWVELNINAVDLDQDDETLGIGVRYRF